MKNVIISEKIKDDCITLREVEETKVCSVEVNAFLNDSNYKRSYLGERPEGKECFICKTSFKPFIPVSLLKVVADYHSATWALDKVACESCAKKVGRALKGGYSRENHV